MFNKKVIFIKGILVKECHNTLPGSTLAQCFLFFNSLFTPSQKQLIALLMQFLYLTVKSHDIFFLCLLNHLKYKGYKFKNIV